MAAMNPRLPFTGTKLKRRLDSSPVSLAAKASTSSIVPSETHRQLACNTRALPLGKQAREGQVGLFRSVSGMQARRAGPPILQATQPRPLAQTNPGVNGIDAPVNFLGGICADYPTQLCQKDNEQPKRFKRLRKSELSPSTQFVDVAPQLVKMQQPRQRTCSRLRPNPMRAASKTDMLESDQEENEHEEDEEQEEEEEEGEGAEVGEGNGESKHHVPVPKVSSSSAVPWKRSQSDKSDGNSDDRAFLPDGAIDIYGDPSSPLWKHRPRVRPEGQLEVHSLPLRLADEDLRKSIEVVLHSACSDPEAKTAISHLLGLSLNGMGLRSGRQTSRCQVASGKDDFHLIWEEVRRYPPIVANDRRAVGALVLRRPPSCRSGAVIDHVCASRSLGGAGWPMVCAAEKICRLVGRTTLYSAADLEQDGRWGNRHDSLGRGISAVEAHERWRFENSSRKEWKAAGLELYNSKTCSVRYMKKQLASS